MTLTAWRDKGRIHLYGDYASIPVATPDFAGAMYYVIDGASHVGYRYLCDGTEWIEIPGDPMTEHGNEIHEHEYLWELPEHTHPAYLNAVPVHGVDKHSGIIARMPYGITMPASVDCPQGAGYVTLDFPKIAIAGTSVYFTTLYIKFRGQGPTAELLFPVKFNGELLDTITVAAEGVSASKVLAVPRTVTDGDYLALDCPDDSKSAAGLGFYVDLTRAFIAT